MRPDAGLAQGGPPSLPQRPRHGWCHSTTSPALYANAQTCLAHLSNLERLIMGLFVIWWEPSYWWTLMRLSITVAAMLISLVLTIGASDGNQAMCAALIFWLFIIGGLGVYRLRHPVGQG